MTETKLRYSEPLLREAVRFFVRRSLVRGLGFGSLVAICLVMGGVALQIANGDRGWFVGAMVSFLVFVCVFLALIYVAHFRNTIGRFREMRNPEATLSLHEAHFTVTSELGSATMPWSSITEIWHHPRFWLILFSRSQFSTLPLDCLSEEARAFITRKTQRGQQPANQ